MPKEQRGQQNLNLTKSTRGIFKDEVSGQKVGNTSWEVRISLRAQDKSCVFTNLMKHINEETLLEAYNAINGNKALGVDKISKSEYGKNLEGNLKDLCERVTRGTYRPMPKREVLIPKENGKMRPLAIAAFEDKLVDWCVSKILTQVYEPLFINYSFGYRPNKSAEGAIRTVYKTIEAGGKNIVEIDFSNFFNTIPHKKLMRVIGKRIADKRFLSLVLRLLTGEIIRNGETEESETGTPQGGIASPVLANIYLNEVIDQWFMKGYGTKGTIVRYADDVIFLFKDNTEAEEFLLELKGRVEEYGITLNMDKSGTIDMNKTGSSVNFLGLTIYWGKRGKQRKLKVKTEKAKHYKAINAFYKWIKVSRNRMKLKDLWEMAKAKIRGYINYYGYWTNQAKVFHFLSQAIKSLYKWINRRSQKISYTWEGLMERIKQFPLIDRPDNLKWKQLGKEFGYVK
jgi:group II intron reverse transcriptase/maturase